MSSTEGSRGGRSSLCKHLFKIGTGRAASSSAGRLSESQTGIPNNETKLAYLACVISLGTACFGRHSFSFPCDEQLHSSDTAACPLLGSGETVML